MENLEKLEAIANELVKAFEVAAPPVPVETMLQHPQPGMWATLNVSQLTGSFLSVKDKYSPRMSLARLLARHVLASPWGEQRDMPNLIAQDEERLRSFARMILMPDDMLQTLTPGSRNPVAMSLLYEVPEDEAEKRLTEWGS